MEDGGVQLARMMTLKNHRQPNVYHIQRRRPQQQSSRCRRTWQHVYVCPSGLGAHAIALTFVMLDCFQHALDNGNLALLARELEQLGCGHIHFVGREICHAVLRIAPH